MAEGWSNPLGLIEGWARSDARLHVGAIATDRHLVAHLPGPGMLKFGGVLAVALLANELLFAGAGVALAPDLAVMIALAALGVFYWRYFHHAAAERARGTSAKEGPNG